MRIFDHMDLMTREVFMPLLCSDTSLNDQADKLMDIMHRIISQIAVTQSQIEVSTQLYTPPFIFFFKNINSFLRTRFHCHCQR